NLRWLWPMVIHNEPRAPLTCNIGPNPLQEYRQTETRCRQELKVDRRPGEPRSETAHSHLVTLQDGKSLTNDGHVALVKVTKWTWRRVTGYAAVNDFSCIMSLLHSYLRNAGKRLAVFLE